MIVALAQVILSDETVVDEAQQSIGSFTTGELDWLRDIRQLADKCATLRADMGTLRRVNWLKRVTSRSIGQPKTGLSV